MHCPYGVLVEPKSARFIKCANCALQCLISLVPEYAPLYTTDIEGICTQCVKVWVRGTVDYGGTVARVCSSFCGTTVVDI